MVRRALWGDAAGRAPGAAAGRPGAHASRLGQRQPLAVRSSVADVLKELVGQALRLCPRARDAEQGGGEERDRGAVQPGEGRGKHGRQRRRSDE